MKKLAFFSFLIIISGSLLLSSCNKDNSDTGPNLNGVVTGSGTPLGNSVKGTIEPSGGTLITDDGKTEFIFPAGALDKATEIEIQVITSNVPLSIGNAFRLLPENTQFVIPVILKYHYNHDELEGTFPEAVFIANQNDDGIWLAHGNVLTDTVNKTISAQLSHFSDWALFSAYQFMVSDEIADPDEEVDLEINGIPGANLFFSLGPNTTSPIGRPEPPPSGTEIEIDQVQTLPVNRGTIETSDGRSTYIAPSDFPSNTSFNLIRIIGTIRISPNQVYHMTQEISLGGTVQFSVDGKYYFINNISFVTTLESTGQSGLAAAIISPAHVLTIPWPGTGVGHFVSGGAVGVSESGFDMEDKSYGSSYFSCPGYTYLTTNVDVSSANKNTYVIRGTFNGTLCIEDGETTCDNFPITKYREVGLTGFFRVRWAPI